MPSEFEEEFETIEEAVRHLMSNDERCRNSDKWLLIRFWQEVDKLPVYIPFDRLDEWTPAESITRARRKIQSDGFLLPTSEEVIKRRFKRSEDMRHYFARR